jgi:GDP-L-fucose synthase
MEKTSIILILGAGGLVGKALTRVLASEGYTDVVALTRNECDCRKMDQIEKAYEKYAPEYVFNCAAVVGGILFNSSRDIDSLFANLLIQMNVCIASEENKSIKKYLFFSSSCCYPRIDDRDISEYDFLNGPLEETCRPYAVAKIAGIEMLRAVKPHDNKGIAIMCTNLYGPHDRFDEERGHVVPAMIKIIHDAKKDHKPSVVFSGDGKPRRDLLYVDDACYAAIAFMNARHHTIEDVFTNVGSDDDISIKQLAEYIKYVVGYKGKVLFSRYSHMNGAMRKKLDIKQTKMMLHWKPQTSLFDGIKKTYDWYLNSLADNMK